MTMLLFILIISEALANSNNLPTVQIATTTYSTCYGRFGRVACWGDNDYGVLGRNDDAKVNLASDAIAIDFGTSFVSKFIYGGGHHSCALSVEKCAKCWGRGNYGQLGDGSTASRGNSSSEMGDAWPCIDFGADFTVDTLGLGEDHSCAQSTNHAVRCWGDNTYNQLGIDSATGVTSTAPTADVLFDDDFVPAQLSVGGWHACALSAEGKCMCWGYNSNGQLGQDAAFTDSYVPLMVDIAIMPNISFVDAGYSSTCAVDADGRMVCWGFNYYGQLGYEDTTHRGAFAGDMGSLLFVDFGPDFAVESISVGYNHRCALSTNREIKVCVTY